MTESQNDKQANATDSRQAKNPSSPPVQTFKVSRPEDKDRKEPLKDVKTYYKWQNVTKTTATNNQDEMALLTEGRKEQEEKKKKCSIV